MDDVKVQLEIDAARSVLERVTEGVFWEQSRYVKDGRREHLPLVARDEQGEVIGGAIVRMIFGDLYIDHVWVNPDWRRRGLGTRIVAEAERLGRERASGWSFCNTMLPSARSFFMANEYDSFAEVADLPPGHTLSFLRKRLRT